MTVSALTPEIFNAKPQKMADASAPQAEPKRQEVASTVEDRIRLRAYQLFEERQGAPGDAETDWYRAEAEIVVPTTPEK